MRHTFTAILICLCSLSLFAQQENQHTMYMFYKMGFNPAYAGSKDAPCMAAIVRNQWIGLEGAPQSQLLTFNMPLTNGKYGVGASIIRNSIGITEMYTFEGVYSYRVPVANGYLRGGIQASVRSLRNDYSDVIGIQPVDTDGAIPTDSNTSGFVPNFGAGLYYQNPKFFVGFSAPRLLENSIDFSNLNDIETTEARHYYGMIGFLIPVGKVELQPQILLSFVENAPMDGDFNINVIYNKKYTVGVSYRLGGSTEMGFGESMSFLAAAEIANNITFGIAYDYTLSEINNYANGTVEGVLQYCFGKSTGEGEDNPRFF